MSRDPFDALRDANPVPSDSLPPAPMGEADRIIDAARHRRLARPAWAVAAAAAVAVLAVGGAWMLWLGADEETAASDPLPVASSTSSTAPIATPAIDTTVFLLSSTDTGPVVVPVPRAVPGTADPDYALFTATDGALAALLAGPTADDLTHDLTTALPDGIDGPPLSVSKVVTNESGTNATVHVPHTWMESGYPTPDGLAQIVFTLTAIEGIDGVEFSIGDSRVTGGVVSGSGALVPEEEFADHPVVDRVVTRLTYEGWMPLAFVERPGWGGEIALPYPIYGFANSIGNQIRLTLEVDERTLWQETVTATCGTPWSACRGEWDWSSWVAEIPDLGVTGGANLVAEVFGSGIEVIDRRVTPITIVARPASSGTTAAPTTVPAAGPEVPSELAVYLLMDADSTHTTPGPHLVPAAWPTAVLSAPLTDPPRQAVEWLLQGPLPGWHESVSPVTTAIPEDARLLGLEIVDGVATVDLSSEFVTDGGGTSTEPRFAQVVFTLTRFDEIDGVRFLIEGTPVTVFDDGGAEIDGVITRDRFEDLLPPILIETPLYWSIEGGSPLVVSGTADVFEATVSVALANGEGLILWEGFTTATCGTGCRGNWSVEIPYWVPTDQLGAVIVWEDSARDGSQSNVREHPVWLTATRGVESGGSPACSGLDVPADLPEQPMLPAAVAETRSALFEAARTCNWDALYDLVGEQSVAVTFGELTTHPVAWLRRFEDGTQVRLMWWLAQTLRLPASTGPANEVEPGADPLWVWPSAFAAESWEAVADADRQALREIYDDNDFEGYAEYGAFIGYRVGIDADGTWLFFLIGD